MTPKQRNPLSTFVLRVVRTLLLAYVAVLVFVYFFQRRLQYFPATEDVSAPREDPYRGLEDVSLRAADGVELRAWSWPGTHDATLVIFHGNAGHRGHRLEWIEALHELGWGVFILDYRGYGGSGGRPSEQGLYLDGEAAWAWLSERRSGRLVLFGESLGGGVAVELARRHDAAALVLQSTFSSAVEVGQAAYPFLPVSLLMKDRYDNIAKIPEVDCPVLCIHGERDTLIPQSLGRALFDKAPEPKEWYAVRGAGHNDLVWVGGREYFQRVDAFLRRFVLKS